MKFLLIIALVVLAAVILVAAFWLWTPDLPRDKLAETYLDRPEDLVDMDGFRLHVRDSGPRDGLAVVMMHGFGSSLHTFEPWAKALSDRYRVIRFDLPGSGLSEPDPTGIYTDQRSMELLMVLLDRLGVERAVLVGNSIGGRLAWRFTATHPERVAKLVLVAPDGFASPGFAYGRAPDVPLMLSLMTYALPKAMLKANLVVAYGNPQALTEPLLERYHALLLATGNRQAMIERMRQTVLVDPVPLLKTISVPVLLLWGEKDAMIPLANAQDYLAALPNARLVSFPMLGHLPHEEATEQSLVPVRAFLDE